MSDWTEFTPTMTDGSKGRKHYYKRVGKTVYITGKVEIPHPGLLTRIWRWLFLLCGGEGR